MPTTIGIEETQRLLSQGAQLVGVLSEGKYTELRLPKAINIPLKKVTKEATEVLDKSKPVVVCCYDLQ